MRPPPPSLPSLVNGSRVGHLQTSKEKMSRTSCLIILAFAGLLGCSGVYAQAPAVKNTVRQAAASAGADTVRIGSVDCLVTPCGADIIDRAIDQHPKINTPGGLPEVEGDGQLRNPSGNKVPVKVKARVGGAASAKIIGKALAKGLIPGVGLAVAVVEVAEELGFGLEDGSSGEIVVKKKNPGPCTVAPCYQYRLSSDTAWFADRQAAVNAWLAFKNTSVTEQWRSNGVTETGGSGYGIAQTQFALSSSPSTWVNSEKWFSRQTVAPSPPGPDTYSPSTQQEFLDAIASKSGWPSTSAIREALSEASKSTGDSIEVIPSTQTVTGPASTPGTSTTTNNTTNNTTTNETTTHHHTYEGDTVTTTNQTTTTVINNTTGDTISNVSSSSTKAAPPPEIETCGLPGKPPCKLDETGTPEGKDALKIDDFDAKLLEREAKLTDITSATGKDTSWGVMPNWTEQGTCSAWHIYTLPAALGSRSVDVDLCPIKPYADGASNFIWVALAFFGITSMVFATMTSKGT